MRPHDHFFLNYFARNFLSRLTSKKINKIINNIRHTAATLFTNSLLPSTSEIIHFGIKVRKLSGNIHGFFLMGSDFVCRTPPNPDEILTQVFFGAVPLV